MKPRIDVAQIDRLLDHAEPDVIELIEMGLRDKLDPEQFAQYRKELEDLIFNADWPDPPMDEYLFNSRYLGLPKSAIFPAVLDVLMEADKPDVREVYACVGRGGGKSTIICAVLSKAVYRLFRRFRDPSTFFGVLPGTPIGVINMSPTSEQAENVIFNRLTQLFNGATCFHNEDGTAPFRKVKRHLEFPRNIHVQSGHSNFAAYLGYDVFAGAIDEMSFFLSNQANPVAEDVYQALKGSALSRFPDEFKLLCISSPEAKDDPLYSRVDNVLRNGTPIYGRAVRVELDGDSYGKVVS